MRVSVFKASFSMQKTTCEFTPMSYSAPLMSVSKMPYTNDNNVFSPSLGRQRLCPSKEKPLFSPKVARTSQNNVPPHRPQCRAPRLACRSLQLPQLDIQRIHRTLDHRALTIIANVPLQYALTSLNFRHNDILRNRAGCCSHTQYCT